MSDVETTIAPAEREGLAELAAGPQPLLVLTDEELHVVTAEVAPDDRLLPLEVVDALDEQERALAARTAFRGLVARGLAAPVADPEVDEARGLTELEVRAPLITVLDLLARPWPTVLVAREVDGASCRRALLTLGDLVLEHEARVGYHSFSLFTAADAATELAAFLDPTAAAGDEDAEVLRGPADTPPPGWARLREQLDEPGASASLVALRDPDRVPPTLLFEVGVADGQLVLVTGEHADTSGEATEVAVRGLSRASVLGLAAHALSLEDVVVSAEEP
jgi:hypothetical protein